MLDRVPRETYKWNDLVYRAAALGGLGRAEQTRAAVAETLARFPRMTVEYGAWWLGLTDADWRRLLETMRKAGFPPCSREQDLRDIPDTFHLPECKAERAKTASSKT